MGGTSDSDATRVRIELTITSVGIVGALQRAHH